MEQQLINAGWTLYADTDGLQEYRGPYDMVAYLPAHKQFVTYYRAYWEKLRTSYVWSPLSAAYECFAIGTVLQPKPRGYKHGLPKRTA